VHCTTQLLLAPGVKVVMVVDQAPVGGHASRQDQPSFTRHSSQEVLSVSLILMWGRGWYWEWDISAVTLVSMSLEGSKGDRSLSPAHAVPHKQACKVEQRQH
jgi:hypothetical protein